MASRAELLEQKKKTSNALIKAAIEICEDEGYASLSIRSVARKVGIAPTSFYRHYRDIDELGIAIVDKAKSVLINCFQQIRNKISENFVNNTDSSEQTFQSIESVVRPFVETFIECMKENSQLLCLFFQERTGHSKYMRKAISEGIDNLVILLSQDLKRIAQNFSQEISEFSFMAEAMIALASYDSVAMILDQKCDNSQMIEVLIKKLNLLLLGASKYIS
jgi:AcrR family transcriptional regulator